MAIYDFSVDSVDDSGRVLGLNNGNSDIPLGVIFTGVRKVRYVGDLKILQSIDLGIVAAVRLTLKQVRWYHREIECIPRGHSAGLFVDGEGLEELISLLRHAGPRERHFLVAPLLER